MATTTVILKDRTKARLKAKCLKEGKTMKEVIEKLVNQYLREK